MMMTWPRLILCSLLAMICNDCCMRPIYVENLPDLFSVLLHLIIYSYELVAVYRFWAVARQNRVTFGTLG